MKGYYEAAVLTFGSLVMILLFIVGPVFFAVNL